MPRFVLRFRRGPASEAGESHFGHESPPGTLQGSGAMACGYDAAPSFGQPERFRESLCGYGTQSILLVYVVAPGRDSIENIGPGAS